KTPISAEIDPFSVFGEGIESGLAALSFAGGKPLEWQIRPKQCHRLAALSPWSCHMMVACFRAIGPKAGYPATFLKWNANGFLAEPPQRRASQGRCAACRRNDASDGSTRLGRRCGNAPAD